MHKSKAKDIVFILIVFLAIVLIWQWINLKVSYKNICSNGKVENGVIQSITPFRHKNEMGGINETFYAYTVAYNYDNVSITGSRALNSKQLKYLKINNNSIGDSIKIVFLRNDVSNFLIHGECSIN